MYINFMWVCVFDEEKYGEIEVGIFQYLHFAENVSEGWTWL